MQKSIEAEGEKNQRLEILDKIPKKVDYDLRFSELVGLARMQLERGARPNATDADFNKAQILYAGFVSEAVRVLKEEHGWRNINEWNFSGKSEDAINRFVQDALSIIWSNFKVEDSDAGVSFLLDAFLPGKGERLLDCDTSAILAGEILKKFGIEAQIVTLPRHAILKVNGQGNAGLFFETRPEFMGGFFYHNEEHVSVSYPLIYSTEKLGFDDTALRLALGNEHFNAGKYEEAIKEFLRASEMAPKNAGAFLNLGICYREKGEYKKSILAFEDGMRLCKKMLGEYKGPSDDGSIVLADFYYNMALTYEKLGNGNQASVALSNSIDALPTPSACLKYAEICWATGKDSLAVSYLERILIEDARNRNNPHFYYQLWEKASEKAAAFLEKIQKAYSRALPFSTGIQEHNDMLIKVHYALGVWHSARGQEKAAIDELNAALILDDKFASAYLERGRLYLKIGQQEKGIADLEKASSLRPDAESFYLLGGVLYSRKEHGRAIDCLVKSLELVPNSALTPAYEILYEIMGQYENGKLKLNGKDAAGAYYGLGIFHKYVPGESPEYYFKKAKKLDPAKYGKMTAEDMKKSVWAGPK